MRNGTVLACNLHTSVCVCYGISQCRTECKCCVNHRPTILFKEAFTPVTLDAALFHLSLSESAGAEFLNTPLEPHQGLCIFLAWNIFYLLCLWKKFASSDLCNNASCFDMKPASSFLSHPQRHRSGIMLWESFSTWTAQVLQESADHDANKVYTQRSFSVEGLFLSISVRLCPVWPMRQAGVHRCLETCICWLVDIRDSSLILCLAGN